MKINVVELEPAPPPKEVVLRCTEDEARTIRRALYVAAQARIGSPSIVREATTPVSPLWAPLDGADRLYNQLVAAGVA